MKVLEDLKALEEEYGCIREEIFISPPDSAIGDFTDEDSGDEVASKVPTCPAVFYMPLLYLRITAQGRRRTCCYSQL